MNPFDNQVTAKACWTFFQLETDARPGPSESQKKPTATGSDQPRVIEHVHSK